MKRCYMIHESAWESQVQFAYTTAPLWHSFEGKGCTWIDLPDGYRLVTGDFASEDREAAWNGHKAVVHLHHPVKEKSLPLSHLLTSSHAHKRFTATHLDVLSRGLGVTEADTMETLNEKIAAVHPGCAIYATTKTVKAQAKTSKWIY